MLKREGNKVQTLSGIFVNEKREDLYQDKEDQNNIF